MEALKPTNPVEKSCTKATNLVKKRGFSRYSARLLSRTPRFLTASTRNRRSKPNK